MCESWLHGKRTNDVLVCLQHRYLTTPCRHRVDGFRLWLELFQDVTSDEDKARVILGLLEVIHSQDTAHFFNELEGISTNSLESVKTAWRSLATAIIERSEYWLSACRVGTLSTYALAKQESIVTSLLCGMSAVILDYRPIDASLIIESKLINFLSSASKVYIIDFVI